MRVRNAVRVSLQLPDGILRPGEETDIPDDDWAHLTGWLVDGQPALQPIAEKPTKKVDKTPPKQPSPDKEE